MFFKTFRSSQTARRIALVAAPLAVIGAAVSTASAADRDGRGWGWGHRSRGPNVAIHAEFPGARVVIGRRVECVDEVPAGLTMIAYQSKDRVIILVSGTNRGSGYSTSLSAGGRGGRTSLVLHNTAPLDNCREGACSFSLTASICAERELHSICMQIGDRTYDIPVMCVQSLT